MHVSLETYSVEMWIGFSIFTFWMNRNLREELKFIRQEPKVELCNLGIVFNVFTVISSDEQESRKAFPLNIKNKIK